MCATISFQKFSLMTAFILPRFIYMSSMLSGSRSGLCAISFDLNGRVSQRAALYRVPQDAEPVSTPAPCWLLIFVMDD